MYDNPPLAPKLDIVRVLDALKPYITVARYPRKKSSIIKYNIPLSVQGVDINKYLSLKFNLTEDDQNFVLNNLMYCRYLQPEGNSVTVVGINCAESKPVVVKTTSYGVFNIFGTLLSQVHLPGDSESYIKSYLCDAGVIAYVHRYLFNGEYVTCVYYGDNLTEIMNYLELMCTRQMYSKFIQATVHHMGIKLP